MIKFTAQTKSDLAQKGMVNPLIIGGVVVLAIIVFLVTSGSLKFSGYVRTDSNKSQDNQGSQTAQPQPTQESKPAAKLNAEPYKNSKYDYSISYPDGWKVKEQSTNVNFYQPSATKGGDQADALVSVVAGDLGDSRDMKLTTLADLHKTYLKKQFSNVEFIGEKEVKVSGQDGYELEFTGTINTEKMHGRYIVLKGNSYIYAVIGMANVGLWDGEKSTIDSSIQTFKLQ